MEHTSAQNVLPGTNTIADSPNNQNSISSAPTALSSHHNEDVTKNEEIVSLQKKYCKISNDKRLELISSVEDKGQTIKAAAAHLSINYSSAKSIYNIYKKEGRSNKKGVREVSTRKRVTKNKNLNPSLSTTPPSIPCKPIENASKGLTRLEELKEPVKPLLAKREHPDCPSDEKTINLQLSAFNCANDSNKAGFLQFSGQAGPNCGNFPQAFQIHQGQQISFVMPMAMAQSNSFNEKNFQNKQEFNSQNGANTMICSSQHNNQWHQAQPPVQSFIIINPETQSQKTFQHFVLKPIEQWSTNQLSNQVNQVTNAHHSTPMSMNMQNCSSNQTVTTFYPNQTLQVNQSSHTVEQFQFPTTIVSQPNNVQMQSYHYPQPVMMVPVNSNIQQNNFMPVFNMPTMPNNNGFSNQESYNSTNGNTNNQVYGNR